MPPVEGQPAAESARPTVLVVDDEPHTLSAVSHLLRKRYRVLGAPLASRALEILAVEQVSVVLCDQRLPDLPGDRLVAEVRRRWPETVRLMMTAHWDHAALAYAVNHGQIFGFVHKPWNDEELERAVDSAVAFSALTIENRRITEALRASNERLSRVNAELRQLTYVVAHDLKEPLRTLMAYGQILQEDLGDKVTGESAQHLSGIERCGGHLRQLIDDLLLVSELEQVQLTWAELELSEVLAQVEANVDGDLLACGGRLVIDASAVRLEGDANRLVLLFQNLVANGLKFNRSAVPTVEVTAGPGAPGWIRVRVRDNGMGVPSEFRERIFDLFQRLNGKREFSGTGAGLAVVRKIALAHGGSVSIEDAPGSGTTFVVDLPERRSRAEG